MNLWMKFVLHLNNKMAKRIKKPTQKQIKEMHDEYIDFWSRCITESIFYLTPYILIFIVLGIIFS